MQGVRGICAETLCKERLNSFYIDIFSACGFCYGMTEIYEKRNFSKVHEVGHKYDFVADSIS